MTKAEAQLEWNVVKRQLAELDVKRAEALQKAKNTGTFLSLNDWPSPVPLLSKLLDLALIIDGKPPRKEKPQ